MAKPRKLIEVTPERVQHLLDTHGTQAAVARLLGVTQASLSRYMQVHKFRRVERWQRGA